MWFGPNRVPENEVPEAHGQTTDAWPPTFETYEEYKDKLRKAIDAHPPFGEWLLKHRNLAHIMKPHDSHMWASGMDVETLKARYLKEEKVSREAKYSKRLICELHLDYIQDEVKRQRCLYEESHKMYKSIMAEEERKRECGYAAYCQRIMPPKKSELLVIEEYLQQEVIENMDSDVRYDTFKRTQVQSGTFELVPWTPQPMGTSSTPIIPSRHEFAPSTCEERRA